MRKNRKNKLIICLSVTILILILIFLLIFFIVKNSLPSEIEVSLNEKFPVEYKTKVAFFEIKLKAMEKIDTNKILTKKIHYTYKYFFFNCEKIISVSVKDKEPPKFTKFTDSLEIYLNDEFKEPEYEVVDNYDKVEDLKVTITGSVDTKKKGSYYLVYKAVDISGNEIEQVQKVIVTRESPLKMSNADFDLTSYFPDTILKETKDMGEEYLNQIVLAGDSVYWYFPQYGLFDAKRVWAKPCVGPSNIYTEKIDMQNNYTIPELISINKPKYLILNMGGCECQRNNVEQFIDSYRKFLVDMKEKYPSVKIIVQTFNPVNVKQNTPYINNEWRNKFNYYLVELCDELDIPVLDVINLFKDENGECKAGMCMSDGYHPNELGMKKMLEFIRTHGYAEVGP